MIWPWFSKWFYGTQQTTGFIGFMEKAPQAIPLAQKAMQVTGLSPRLTSVRGGTDGSRLTEKGLPCPNLSCGEP